MPDAFASTANYLKKSKWDPEASYVYKIQLSKKGMGRYFTTSKSHVFTVDKADLLSVTETEEMKKKLERIQEEELKLVAVVPEAGKPNEYFVVGKNFFVIKKWNLSNYFCINSYDDC